MSAPRRSLIVVVVLVLLLPSVTGLVMPSMDVQQITGGLAQDVPSSRALSQITHTTLADFNSGTHDMTMATNRSGGALQMRTMLTLASSIPGDSGVFSLTTGLDGTIFAGGMTSGRMARINSSSNLFTDVNNGNQMVAGENFISALTTGNDGTIWGGTGGGIVFRMDPSTEAITVLNGSNPVDPSMVAGFTVLSNGSLWAATAGRVVFEIDPSTDGIINHGDLGGLVPGEIRALSTDLGDNVWLGCTDGVDSYLMQVNTVTKAVDWHGKAVVGDTTIKALVTATNGSLWGGTDAGTTLFRVDPGTPPIITTFGNPTGGASTETTTMTIGPEGNIIAGTRFASHIYQFDQRSGVATDFGRFFPNTIALRGFTTGLDGSVWGGTQASTGDGLLFRFYPYATFTSPIEGETWIGALAATPDGMVWGATQDDNDINRGSKMFTYDPTSDIFTVINGGNPLIASESITTLTLGADGRLWGGTDAGSLVFSLNTTTHAVTYANGSNPITPDANTDLITGMDGTIWGATNGGRVFRVDPSDGGTTVLNDGDEVLPGIAFIDQLAVASNGTIWGGSQVNGHIFSIDPGDDSVQDHGQAVSGQSMVFALVEGTDHNIYGTTFEIGQAGHVFCFAPSTGQFTDLGVPSSGSPMVPTLVPDGEGRIWGGTQMPNSFFSIKEATGAILGGPGVVPTYQQTDELVLAPNGDIWGMSQGNRFGGDQPVLFRYIPTASYLSPSMDMGVLSHVSYLNWTETSGLNNITLRLRMRSAATEGLLSSAPWSPYLTSTGQAPVILDARWVQYEVIFQKLDTGLGASAIVEEVEISYKAVPFMTVEKMVDKASVKRGEEVTYTIFFNNTGPVASTDVYVNDTLDPGLELVSSSDDANRTGTSWYYPTIPASASRNLTFTVRVNSSATAGTTINNTADLQFSDTEGEVQGVISSNMVSTLVDEVDMPSLTVSKTASATIVQPGDTLEYTITVSNGGPGIADNITVTDYVDPALTITQTTGDVGGSSPTWDLGGLTPGETKDLVITTSVDAFIDYDLTIQNNATVNWTTVLGDPLVGAITNTVSTLIKGGPAPVLQVRKEVDLIQAEPGDMVSYTIYFNNTGNAPAENVRVTDVLSSHLVFNSSDHDDLKTDHNWTFTAIAPDEGGILRINATVAPGVENGTLIPNNATISYENGTGVLVETLTTNTVSTTITIIPTPVIKLELLVDKAVASPGDELTYVIYYNNTGTAPAPRVTIIDSLPTVHLIFQNSSSYYDVPYQWNLTNVAVGPHELIVKAIVREDVDRDTRIINVVQLNYTDEEDKPVETLQASVETICLGTGEDKKNPSVAGHLPMRGDYGIPIDTQIEIHFSEAMNTTSVEQAITFDPPVEGNFTWVGNVLYFKPTKDLDYNTPYTVTVGTGAKDLAGNPMLSPYPITFRTEVKDYVPEDQGNLICYVMVALAAGLLMGIFIFYVAYRRKFKEMELARENLEEEKKEEEPEPRSKRRKVEEDDDMVPEGSMDDEEVEELEEEAGAGPEESLVETEDEGLEEEAEAETEKEEADMPEEPEEKSGSTDLDDIMRKLKG
jgi:uncharacterized repeat protein (TIGR01451 family)